MGDVVPIMEPMALAYAKVRDATVCNGDLPLAEKIAVLNVVLFECNANFEEYMKENGRDG